MTTAGLYPADHRGVYTLDTLRTSHPAGFVGSYKKGPQPAKSP